MSVQDVAELHRGYALLWGKCPRCGDRLIWNKTGIECGAMRCTYAQGGKPYNKKEVEEAMPQEQPSMGGKA